MDNENCLSGMRCPVCRHEKDFAIQVVTERVYSDDGSDPFDRRACHDEEWDENSPCRCLHCNYSGSVDDFRGDPQAGNVLRHYLVVVWNDLEPEAIGPFDNEEQRDKTAKAIRRTKGRDHGIFPTVVYEGGALSVGAYSGGFFADMEVKDEG